MSNSIQVTTTTIKNKASELKRLNSRLKSQIQSLTSTESRLNGMWEGDTHDAFHRAFVSDTTQMNNFYNAIEQYVHALENIAAKYESAERTNLSTANTRKYK